LILSFTKVPLEQGVRQNQSGLAVAVVVQAETALLLLLATL
jgi:hypothetical protein